MSAAAESQESNDKLFAIVAKELSIGKKDDALWTKAFALENGDANRSNAHYIRLRVEKLRQFGSNAEAATEGENSSDTAEGVPEPSASQSHTSAQGGIITKPLRWGIGLLATIVLFSIYGIWKDVERHVGGGFLTGLLRGAIVFGGLAGIWLWVMGRERIKTKKQPRPTGDKENLMPLYVLTAVIAVGMVFFLVSQQKPQVEQSAPTPSTTPHTGMFDDLYKKPVIDTSKIKSRDPAYILEEDASQFYVGLWSCVKNRTHDGRLNPQIDGHPFTYQYSFGSDGASVWSMLGFDLDNRWHASNGQLVFESNSGKSASLVEAMSADKIILRKPDNQEVDTCLRT